MKNPYWRWLCKRKRTTRDNCLTDENLIYTNWINGSFFIALIDRLKYENVDTSPIEKAFENILVMYKENLEDIDLQLKEFSEQQSYSEENVDRLIETNRYELICNDLEIFVDLLKGCKEYDYPLLEELSEEVFKDLKIISYSNELDDTMWSQAIDKLEASIVEVKNNLRDNILNSQINYFDNAIDYRKNSIHLGYKVYCIEYMDRFINQCFRFNIWDEKQYNDIDFPINMYEDLLDWDRGIE